MKLTCILRPLGLTSTVLLIPAAASASFINYASKEINVKIVYYGPSSAGLMENLDHIYKRTRPKFKGKMISLETETDRVVFFDFISSRAKIRGFALRLHLYTVPGQFPYEASRKLILKGVDAVVFVADADRRMANATLESWKGLKANLDSQGYDWKTLPLVIQLDVRDPAIATPPEEMRKLLGLAQEPLIQADASRGAGVFETLNEAKRMIRSILESGSSK